ncbi:DevA family ABC transporter ATP-binding protein [Oscillatoria sp. CS-180]|uniref:DevA family ABC transporter ATP-binding protein n=1 Tax=Oscillatoria sp. CS-180 TaxID=3021720 RepID=UPI002330BC60|nr:DevA family ABC transporter ATP-binding protein [Oscillatoria sp. CS-180]MDB9526150.1 DevA family ABC transporter ATP-binding protein [Oscillatoria sp. CS-180]
MTLSNPILSIQNLNHYYGEAALKRQVLSNINFKIHPQEIVILTGPSGSGKTTLLTLIGGLRSVQQGQLQFLGQYLNAATPTEMIKTRRKIGYIFQAHNLMPFLTASQNVQLSFEFQPSLSRQEAIARSEQMLAAVRLKHRLNYYPQSLSGGEKQRVAIARALVTDPPLILADEPTASLDSKTGRDVVELMQVLAKDKGSAVLLVTHDNRILDVADRIIRMEDGCLICD